VVVPPLHTRRPSSEANHHGTSCLLSRLIAALLGGITIARASHPRRSIESRTRYLNTPEIARNCATRNLTPLYDPTLGRTSRQGGRVVA
jgi:hypothetical protein